MPYGKIFVQHNVALEKTKIKIVGDRNEKKFYNHLIVLPSNGQFKILPYGNCDYATIFFTKYS